MTWRDPMFVLTLALRYFITPPSQETLLIEKNGICLKIISCEIINLLQLCFSLDEQTHPKPR